MSIELEQTLSAWPHDKEDAEAEQGFLKHMVGFVLKTDPEKLAEIPIKTRFTLISHMKEALFNRFPQPEDIEEQERIDEDLIPDEIAALKKISETISLSADYKNFIISVTEQAVEKLTSDVNTIKQLINWENEDRQALCEKMHASMIEAAQDILGRDTAIAQHLHQVPVIAFEEVTRTSQNGKKLTKRGVAKTDPDDESLSVQYNTHEHAKIENASQAAYVIYHETGHIIEKQLAALFNENPSLIPENIREDAEKYAISQKEGGYIPSALYSAYREQFIEQICFEIGKRAETLVHEAVTKPTHPGL